VLSIQYGVVDRSCQARYTQSIIFAIYNVYYVGFPQVMTVFKTLFPLSLENYENARRVLNKVRRLIFFSQMVVTTTFSDSEPYSVGFVNADPDPAQRRQR
jgi:hypothetical protein